MRGSIKGGRGIDGTFLASIMWQKNLRGVSANTQVSDLRSLQIDTSARLL